MGIPLALKIVLINLLNHWFSECGPEICNYSITDEKCYKYKILTPTP